MDSKIGEAFAWLPQAAAALSCKLIHRQMDFVSRYWKEHLYFTIFAVSQIHINPSGSTA
ncbi:hypothetical protein [Shewanella salipaludis]|uniref:Uncharacterized protein n=1 Tax=Shewanella salipaludis TaxID=2723052 RepID=A0A972JJF3_9GAMM|nr:hypothetical protein [Shewanella salipaludis]NMH63984.1 hypothetical protein [Shewanella salipaludis]